LLFTKLEERGFTTEHQDPDKASGVEEIASREKGDSIEHTRSAQRNNLGVSPFIIFDIFIIFIIISMRTP
jgi:hypothetical protein